MDSRVAKHFPDHTHARTHTCTRVPMNALAWGPSHRHTYPLLKHTGEQKCPTPLFFLFLLFCFCFFLKKDLSKYLDNKSFAFPKKLFFFSLVVFAH